ncbi:cell division GTPase FtsZ [Hydrogenispora ethanolica]|jgi:cell division GTPase FtsZ|uniref:Cell division GTPase FtsZ n=1 Tax=Hydrogenispora ethanolica TaxID=1082276 RepID=A0A4R1RS75_HYDET|nr:hypothetical protein [Hydrogenispora ethanolica]TCL69325.1 cell division GTPase FtsZ [Hydrogenispora ethanolica]
MQDKGIQFGFIGCGQGGGKIADLFARHGYKAIAVNTSPVDLAALNGIPPEYRIRIGTRLGAGKDPRIGQEAIRTDAEKVQNVIEEYFYYEVDFVLVCACLGGGTGTGIAADVLEISRRVGLSTGCLATIPLLSESLEEQKNALKGFDILSDVNPTPLYLVDNQLLRLRFGDQAILNFWPNANEAIVGLWDEINQIPNRLSNMFVFDREDYFRLLNTPGCFTPLRIELKLDGEEGPEWLANAMREDVTALLSENNFEGECSRVAALLVCPENYRINAETVELVYQECQNLTNAPTLFRGLYSDPNLTDSVVLYLILAGLNPPNLRLQAIRNKLQELSPEIISRLNRPVTTNFGDELQDWDTPNPLPAARRSFAAPNSSPTVAQVSNVVKLEEERGDTEADALEESLSETAAAQEKEDYKVLTMDQVMNLMEAGTTADSTEYDSAFWDQFKLNNKKR